MAELTAEDRTAFRTAVVDDGINPTQACPVCRSDDVRAVVVYGWCDRHVDWGHPIATSVTCVACKRTWRVAHRNHGRMGNG